MSSIENALERMQENYKKNKESSGGFENWDPDPGTYNGICYRAEVKMSKAGDPGIHTMWAITDGDNTGRRYSCWGGLKSEGGQRMWFQFLRRMGCELPEKMRDLGTSVGEWQERYPHIRFKLKLNKYEGKEYLNFEPVKILEMDTDPEEIPERVSGSDSASPATASEASDDSVEGEDIKVGTLVSLDDGSGAGTVISINDDAGLAEVKLASTGETAHYAGEFLSIINKLPEDS